MSGFIYVLKAADGSLKIGFTTDPKKRISQLQSASSQALKSVCVVPGTRAHERHIHRRLGAYRIRGEWYSSSLIVDECVSKLIREAWGDIGFVKSDVPFASHEQGVAERAAKIILACAGQCGVAGHQAAATLFDIDEKLLWKFLYRPSEPYFEEYFDLLRAVLRAVAVARVHLSEAEAFASRIITEHDADLLRIRHMEQRLEALALAEAKVSAFQNLAGEDADPAQSEGALSED